MDTKPRTCKVCWKTKSNCDFHTHLSARDGYLRECKECVRKRVKKRSQEKKEQDAQRKKQELKRDIKKMKDIYDTQTVDLVNEEKEQKDHTNSAEKAREEGRTPPKAWTLQGLIDENGQLFNKALEDLQAFSTSSIAITRALIDYGYLSDHNACIRKLVQSIEGMEQNLNECSKALTRAQEDARLSSKYKANNFRD